jgi:hypothetical protein
VTGKRFEILEFQVSLSKLWMMCSKHSGNDDKQALGTKAQKLHFLEAIEDQFSCEVCQSFDAVREF